MTYNWVLAWRSNHSRKSSPQPRPKKGHNWAGFNQPLELLEPSFRPTKTRKMRLLSQENASLRQGLENRKIIESAKKVLMKRFHWSESEAYQRLQRGAMYGRTTMVDLAQAILSASGRRTFRRLLSPEVGQEKSAIESKGDGKK